MIDSNSPEAILAQMLELADLYKSGQREEVRRLLQGSIDEDVDLTSLYMIDVNNMQVPRWLDTGNYMKAILYDPAPYLMVFRKDTDKQSWRLHLFSTQCLSCFGNGIMYGPCDTCGGTGWGSIGEVEYCAG